VALRNSKGVIEDAVGLKLAQSSENELGKFDLAVLMLMRMALGRARWLGCLSRIPNRLSFRRRVMSAPHRFEPQAGGRSERLSISVL